MPPKTKISRQLEHARARKLARSNEDSQRRDETRDLPDHDESLDCSSDDANFDPSDSLTTEEDIAIAEEHFKEWVSLLHRDDIMSLSTMHLLMFVR